MPHFVNDNFQFFLSFCFVKEFFSFHLLGPPDQNYGLQAQPSLPLIFINNVLLQHGHVNSSTYCLRQPLHYTAQWSSYESDRVACKKPKIFTPWPFVEVCQPSSRSVSFLFFTASDYIVHLKILWATPQMLLRSHVALVRALDSVQPSLTPSGSHAKFCFLVEHCRGGGVANHSFQTSQVP